MSKGKILFSDTAEGFGLVMNRGDQKFHSRQEGESIIDLFRRIGLDWDVEIRLNHVVTGYRKIVTGYDTVKFNTPNMSEIPLLGNGARASTGRFNENGEWISFGAVGRGRNGNFSYNPLQNMEFAMYLTQMEKEFNGLITIKHIGSSHGGARLKILAKLPERLSFREDIADQGDMYLVLFNGHDGIIPAGVGFTTIRTACMNAMPMIIRQSRSGPVLDKVGAVTFRRLYATIRHTKNVDVWFQTAADILLGIDKVREEMNATFNQLSQVFLPDNEWKKICLDICLSEDQKKKVAEEGITYDTLSDIIPAKSVAQVERLYSLRENGMGQKGLEDTVTGGINAVTQFCTWDKGSKIVKRDGQQIFVPSQSGAELASGAFKTNNDNFKFMERGLNTLLAWN